MTRFIGRSWEISRLSGLLDKKSASFVVLRGRRRIGKSRLLQEFSKGLRTITFSGLPPTPKTTDESQRAEFARQMAKNIGMPLINANDWSDLFWFLAEQVKTGRILIVLDEISWIGSKDPDFLGKPKNIWDLKLSLNPDLLLIVCGSVSSWIEENILSSTGFLGRVSLDLVLHELPLSDCKLFWENQQGRTSSYEIFKVLAVTGGVPKYLEEINTRKSAEENIRELCFQPEGLLFREFEQIFSDLFSKRSTTLSHIVEQLADAPLELDELCKRLNWEKSGNVTDYLKELILAGFVTRDSTWNIKTKKTSNLKRYRLSDNYLRFYLKYIYPNKDQVLLGLFQKKSLIGLLGWHMVMGLQFENLVLNNCTILFNMLGLNPQDIVMYGPFFQRPTRKQKGCQIDLLIQTRYNCLYLCEIKFYSAEVKADVIQELNEKRARLSIPKGVSLRTVLIHVNGVSDTVRDSLAFDYIIDFSDFLYTS
jgi:AAA+ ATPase superfamily predicted ATPase